MSVLHQNSGGIGKSIPSVLEISLDHRPSTSGLRKSLGRRGWISQNLPRFGGARIHYRKELVEHKYVIVKTTIALTERKMVMLLRKAVMEEAGPRTLEKIMHLN